MGVTWMIVAWIVWKWLFADGFNALMGSRKEDLVDNKAADSLFGKAEYIIERLPNWMWPIGWDSSKHRTFAKIINPENDNTIQGESANRDFSRQGRYSCLVGDTLVQTPSGLMKIKDAMKDNVDEFIGADGTAKKVRAYLKRLPEPLLRIKTEYGYEVTGTQDHPLLTNSGFKKMGSLTIRDSLKIKSVHSFPKVDLITGKQARIMGWLVSEGSVSTRGLVQFCQKEEYLVDDFIKDFEDAFGVKMFKRKVERTFPNGNLRTWFIAERNIIKVRNYLDSLGLHRVKALDKEVPHSVLSSSKEVQIEFLKALYEGDGCASVPKSLNRLRISYTTKSFRLAQQVQMMLLNFGLLSSIKIDKRRGIYTVDMNSAWAKKFCEIIGFISKRKNSVHLGYTPSRVKNQFTRNIKSSEWYLPIRSIEEVEPDNTYDLELEGHKFIANGIVSHNCIFLDEFAFWDYASSVWTATADSSPCRVVVSTPNGKNNVFARLRFPNQSDEQIKVITLHWKLHPLKDDDWYIAECNRRRKKDIAQELDINYEATGNEKVFEILRTNSDLRRNVFINSFQLPTEKYVTPDNIERERYLWRMNGGLDYGTRNKSAFIVVATDYDGRNYVVWEWRRNRDDMLLEGFNGSMVSAIANMLKSCPYYQQIERIYADPSLWTDNQNASTGMTSIYRQLYDEGITKLFRGANSDSDGIERILTLWSDSNDPMLKVFKDECSGLRKELEELMWDDWSDSMGEKKNKKEKIVDKNNHSYDALKYFVLSKTYAPKRKEEGKLISYDDRVRIWMKKRRKQMAKDKKGGRDTILGNTW